LGLHISLWLFNIAMEAMAQIEIDGLPIKHGDFPMAMLNNQRVQFSELTPTQFQPP